MRPFASRAASSAIRTLALRIVGALGLVVVIALLLARVARWIHVATLAGFASMRIGMRIALLLLLLLRLLALRLLRLALLRVTLLRLIGRALVPAHLRLFAPVPAPWLPVTALAHRPLSLGTHARGALFPAAFVAFRIAHALPSCDASSPMIDQRPHFRPVPVFNPLS